MPLPQFLTDVVPWPSGVGFQNAHDWWVYVLAQDETSRVDHLFGLAFLNPSIGKRLLQHDETLFTTFQLSAAVCNTLRAIQVNSLEAFAQAFLDAEARL